MTSNAPVGLRQAVLHFGASGPEPIAVRFAAEIAEALGAQLSLAFTPPPSMDEAAVQQALLEAQALVGAPAPLPTNVVRDPEADLKRMDPQAVQLVIFGASKPPVDPGEGRLAAKLAVRSKAGVLIIHNPPESIERLLICTGGHPASNIVIDWGLQIAAHTGAQATILHVAGVSPSMFAGMGALDETLEGLLAHDTPLSRHLREAAKRAQAAGVSTRLELRHGIVAEEILRTCELEHYDLIVIGAPEPGALLDRVALGRVAPQLLPSTQISLLIVRPAPQ